MIVKKLSCILLVLLIIALVISVAYLIMENLELKDKNQGMFRSCIETAVYHFDMYMKNGNQLQYDQGISEIYGALIMALTASDYDEDYSEISLYLNKCYGCLTQNKEQSKGQLERLVRAMKQFVEENSLGAFGAELNSFANSVMASSKSE